MNNTEFDKQPDKGCLSLLRENLLLVLGIVLVFSLSMYCIMGVFGFVAFPDEFGYWSVAGAILGYDWSEITSIGSYYSYGYGVILVIFLKLFKGATAAYRAAIILNALLQCISIPILYIILTDLFPTEQKNIRQIAAVISALYPAWVFYTQTTMAESLLYFLFVFVTYLMLEFLKKPGVLKGIILVIILVCCYFVHMRCIGIIAAGVLTTLIWIISKRKSGISKKVWLIPILIILMFGASFIIKNAVVGRLYSNVSDSVLGWNDYSSIPERIVRIMTGKGILYLLFDVAGKLFYMGMATYGMAYIAFYVAYKKSIAAVRSIRSKNTVVTDYLWIFLSMASLFQFLVALIYLNGASSPENNRIDLFLHGRYIDFFLPLFVGIGICNIAGGKKLLIKAIGCFTVMLCLFAAVRAVFVKNSEFLREGIGFIMVGVSYLFGHPPIDNPVGYLYRETLFGIGLMALVFGAMALYRKLGQKTILLAIVFLQVFLFMHTANQYLFPNQSYIFEDLLLADYLRDVREKNPDKRVIYVFEGQVPYIELVQFEDREAPIHVVNKTISAMDPSEYIDEDTILILGEHAEDFDRAYEFYDHILSMGHLMMFYMK